MASCDTKGHIQGYPCPTFENSCALKWLMVSLLMATFWKMLIRYPSICESIEDGVGPFQHFQQMMPLEVSQTTTNEMAAQAIVDRMRPAYLEDWMRLGVVAEELLLSSIVGAQDPDAAWSP